MHVLLTRPEAEAARMRAELEARGIEVSIAPMLRVELLPIPGEGLTGAQALIATSRNGVRALHDHPALAALSETPLFAVGGGTAALARELGFLKVIEGPAGARELLSIITHKADRAKGPLIHLAGDHLAFDISQALCAEGLQCRSVEAYRTRETQEFPPDIAHLISIHAIDAVILMSPRTAATFVRLLGAAGLAGAARDLAYLCLSPAVASALTDFAPSRIAIATRPSAEEMLALAARVAAKSG